MTAVVQTVYPSLTTTAAAVAGLPPSVRYLRVHNPSATNKLAYTLDGTNPVIGGQGFTVAAGGTDIWDLMASQSTIPGTNSSGPCLTMIGAASQTASVAYSV